LIHSNSTPTLSSTQNARLPRISVVTPTLNQAAFIEATIRSVLDQGYPALDYVVIDGGSADGTQAILQRYSSRLRWVSEPDRGQADAINKGLRMAKGDILAYLNSDDLYLPGTLAQVAGYLAAHPEAGWVYGDCRLIDEGGETIGRLRAPAFDLNRMILRGEYLPQPATFWRRSAAAVAGEFNVALRYSMDYDYFIRLGQHAPGHRLEAELACFRLQPVSKTISSEEKHWRETLMVSEWYGLKPWTAWYWLRRIRHRGLRALPGSWQRQIRRRLGRGQDDYQARHDSRSLSGE
jgi:glycosyltransferase involved in cell wall biosynthesis